MSRLFELFVAPAAPVAEAPVVQVAERAAPAALAVVCGPGGAAVAGGATALGALARSGGRVALVCRWTGHDVAPPAAGALATTAARRLAARLIGRDLTARAHGRLVTVALPGDPLHAMAAAGHAAAAAGGAPVVVVLAAARPAALDPLLAAQDRVIVVPEPGAPEGLEALAVADAARAGRATGVLRLGAGSPSRAAIAAGWLLPPALRNAVAAALDGHGL
jgi:hypothetical protein